MGDPESISSPKMVPQWMRDNRLNIDGIPFSPPSHDDSFFYIRYPLNNKLDVKNTSSGGVQSISEALQKPIKNTISATASDIGENQKIRNQAIDFSKHTEPCKRFLTGANANSFGTLPGQTKSLGTDDGFKGAGAACGSSIVRVAHQMVSGRSFTRGFTVASCSSFDDTDADLETTTSVGGGTSAKASDNKKEWEQQMSQSARNMMRRGSKSLPTSPLGSPKAIRKSQPNPYFTGTFTTVPSTEHRGWFLSSLLGVQREATSTNSVSSYIDEEAEDAATSINNNNIKENKKKSAIPSFFQTNPSELREMNCWSPTSM